MQKDTIPGRLFRGSCLPFASGLCELYSLRWFPRVYCTVKVSGLKCCPSARRANYQDCIRPRRCGVSLLDRSRRRGAAAPRQEQIPAPRTATRKTLARFHRGPDPMRNMPNIPKPAASVQTASTGCCADPGVSSWAVAAVVLMVTVTAAGEAPGVTEVGAIVHTEYAGTPAHGGRGLASLGLRSPR
jgi:hypothetical protein